MKCFNLWLTLVMVCTYQWSTSNLLVSGKSIFSKRSVSKNSSKWSDKVFAPYVQVSSDNKLNIKNVINKTGQKYFTYSFLIAENKYSTVPSWDGEKGAYNAGTFDSEINEIRKNGGDIIISFGGAEAIEIAQTITDETKLYKAYKNVVDYYDLKWIDLDIEGDCAEDSKANVRRNKALKTLKNAYPNLIVAYTLQADYSHGLTEEAQQILQDAYDRELQVDVVNVMAMDYGSESSSEGKTLMGKYAIQTAEKSYEQIKSIGFKNTKIGITPMIGKNDVKYEIFTLSNAKDLVDYANNNSYVRLLAFWAINRDSKSYTGVSQNEFDFTKIFEKFKASSSNPSPTTTSSISQPTSTSGKCGKGYGSCPSGQCCSQYGYCGKTTDYCGKGCQSGYGLCENEEKKECGPGYGSCPSGQCCSQYGYCGKTTDYCGAGCQSGYGECLECGKGIGKCSNGECCSKYGYCGKGSNYCGTGCQSEFGKCN